MKSGKTSTLTKDKNLTSMNSSIHHHHLVGNKILVDDSQMINYDAKSTVRTNNEINDIPEK